MDDADADDFIGTRIKRLREAKGLTALALQRKSGLSQATIYRAERGGVVSDRTAQRLAQAFECPPDRLLHGGNR